MLRISLSKEAVKFQAKPPAKQRQQLARKLYALREDPQPPDSAPLRGAEEYRRADAGEYRIIYQVRGDLLEVLLVGKRNDDEIYRRFKRRGR